MSCSSPPSFCLFIVPVARAADNAKTGKGTIYYDDSSSASSSSNNSDEQKQLEEQPIILSGSGTNFTKELGPKYQIQLGKQYNFATVEVVQVIDDEHVQIKKMFNKDRIVDDLKKGLGYKCLPYIDQTKVRLFSSALLNAQKERGADYRRIIRIDVLGGISEVQ